MKKIIFVIVCILIIMIIGIGCSENKVENHSNETYVIEHVNTKVDSREYFEAFFEVFEAKTNIKVEYDVYSADHYESFLSMRISSGETPDTFQVFPGDYGMAVNSLASKGHLLELTNEPFLTDIHPNVLKPLSINGRYYSLPTSKNVIAILYNRDLFYKAGIKTTPNTLDELYAACDKLKKFGITPYAMEGEKGWFFETFAMAPEYLDENYEIFDKRGWGKIFEVMNYMYKKGYVQINPMAYGYDDANNLFASGNVAIRTTGNWSFSDLDKKIADSFEYVAFFFPYEDSKNAKSNYIQMVAEIFSISAESDKKDQSLILLQYFHDNNDELLKEYNGLPVIVDSDYQSENSASKELMKNIVKMNGVDPSIFWPENINNLFIQLQREVIMDRISVSVAIEDIENLYK